MPKPFRPGLLLFLVCGVASCSIEAQRATQHENAVLDLWAAGAPAFGVFVPDESAAARVQGTGQPAMAHHKPVYTPAGGEKLAQNPLYDFVFLDLEHAYDGTAIKAIAEGLRSPAAVSRKTLLVRIPPFHDGAALAAARIKEAFAAGADGVTIPQVQNVDEARQVLQAFAAAQVNVWSPSNRAGTAIAMLMIEDPGALAQVKAFAKLKGISILACGIGSMTQALGGDRHRGEQAAQAVLAETKRIKVPNMITADNEDVERRVEEGFLALLMFDAQADTAIKIGRAAAGR